MNRNWVSICKKILPTKEGIGYRKSGCSYLPPWGIVAARALNFRVRYGIGCVRRAIAAADEKRIVPSVRSFAPRKPNAIVLEPNRFSLFRNSLRRYYHRDSFPHPRVKKEAESSGNWCVLALQIALPAPDVHRTTRFVVPLPP